MLLVAAILFAVFSTCLDTVAFAATTTYYRWGIVNAEGKVVKENGDPITESSPSSWINKGSLSNENGKVHLKMDDVPWFEFDGWYTDSARTNRTSPLMDGGSDTYLYGTYKFKYRPGDVNGDGKVNGDDITRYCQKIVGNADVVPAGEEWKYATEAQYSSYRTSDKLFFERNAEVYKSGASDLLNLTYLRMAVASGYGLNVVNGEVLDAASDYTTVYFYNHDSWTTPYVHAWSDAGDCDTWPGTKMDSIGSNWFSAQIPAGLVNTKVVFNNGLDTAKTTDTVFEASKPCYSRGLWYTKAESVDSKTQRVYFFNARGWTNINVYYFYKVNTATTQNAEWPGEPMKKYTANSDLNLYYVDIDTSKNNNWQYIIFNNGKNSYQTVDIPLNYNTPFYVCNSTTNNGNYNYVSSKTCFLTTIYYYRGASTAYAYLWNPSYTYYKDANNPYQSYDNAWPGKKMTPVSTNPGWFSYEVPFYYNYVQFNGGSDSTKWDDNKNIQTGNPYYNGGWNSQVHYAGTAYVEIDGVPYYMAYDDSGQDKILRLEIKANQKVTFHWRGGASATVDKGNAGSDFQGNSSGYTVSKTGYYNFYCKGTTVYVTSA